MTTPAADGIGERLDRLDASPKLWSLVVLISLGAFFEIYDVSLTASISPGLVRAGIFHLTKGGLFGLSDQASFAASTFAGLYMGALAFSAVADQYGRKPIFTLALVWYALATVIMGLQTTAVGVDLWRFVAGLGVGLELVAIDCYLVELMPKAMRGKAFAVSNAIQFTAVPVAALLAFLLVPKGLFGVQGWRWLAFFPAVGAGLVWLIRLGLPESPRWLADHGRVDQADHIVKGLEQSAHAPPSPPSPLPHSPAPLAPAPSSLSELERPGASARLWAPPYRKRVIMLSVFHICQTVGYYGFANWVPTLLLAEGVNVAKSLLYSAAIAIAFPVAPMIFYLFADRVERKWQIVVGAGAAAVFGLIYAQQRAPLGWISCGLIVSVANSLMSYAYHAYQSELFPTAIRARAVGFAYSFSRLSAIFSSFLIAWILRDLGVAAVFVLIAGAMGVVVVVISVFGPRTKDRAFFAIS